VVVTIHHGRRWSFDLLWKEPKGDDLALPPEWTRLSPSEWRQWAEQYDARLVGHTHLGPTPPRARTYVVRRAYAWLVEHLFELWARGETEIAERKDDGELQLITAYPPSERDRRNFKIERGKLLHLVAGEVHAVHYDPHYRRRPPVADKVTGTVPVPATASRSRRKSDPVKELAAWIEAIQRDRLHRGEDLADRAELRVLSDKSKTLVGQAMKLVSADLKRPPGQRRNRRR
jgi:hypothetical protein